MKQYLAVILFALVIYQATTDWTQPARIGDVDFHPDFTEEEIQAGIDRAHQQGLSVVMCWLTSNNIDIPQKDLDALKKAVLYAHQEYPHMKIIVYTAPLEVITENVDNNRDGIVDEGKKSMYTEYPEWLQVGLDGRKAVFYGDFESWIGAYDEDVWCCPNDPVYKEKIKDSVRRLAETGVDGIWVDVVMFLCNYGDWDDNWACHCEDCQQKFTEDCGAPIPVTATWDTTWKTWIQWRERCIQEFISEMSQTAKKVNPSIKIIVEHWHGFDAESTENAWSPVVLQPVTDVMAHEYVSASQYLKTTTTVNYLRDMAVYTFYRGVDRDHASWILAYPQDKNGQNMLAASLLLAGCNFYDTVLSDTGNSVSIKERTRIFQWIDQYSDYYYQGIPVANIAVYYSRATINFYDCPSEKWEFSREFMGVSMMLLSSHIPYTVITDLEHIDEYDIVVLPHVVCMSNNERDLLQRFSENGGYIITTGKTGYMDDMGSQLLLNCGMYTDERLFGTEYYDEVAPFFWPDNACEQGTGTTVRKEFLKLLNEAPVLKVETDALAHVVIIPVLLGDRLVLRVLTVGGISPGDAVPEPQTISITSKKILDVVVIPFLSGPEPAEVNGSTVTVPVKDHCLVVLEIEPVSIFCNGYDFPAAESLAVFLQKRGIPVQFVSSPEEASSVLVVFGGHKAEKTGEFVSWLLTDEQKQKLEQKGYKNIFIFEKGRLIIVIAGNEREDTAEQVEESRRDIAAVL